MQSIPALKRAFSHDQRASPRASLATSGLHEIVFADDGSSDRILALLEKRGGRSAHGDSRLLGKLGQTGVAENP